jgi:ferredoxin
MDLQALKPVRVLLATLCFAACAVMFLDLRGPVAVWVSSIMLPLQLVPSLARTLVTAGVWTAGLIGVLLLTLLAGRVYCSTLCPLGTLQDVVIHIAERKKRRRYRYDPPRYALHYIVGGATFAAFLVGSLVLLNLLEPFSNFGRMADALLRPLVAGLNNALAAAGGMVGVHVFQPVPFHFPRLPVLLAAVAALGVIIVLSYRHGRLFCNTLCPAGAILSLVSRVSLFRIVIDEKTCLECGLCEKVCKAACIDAERKMVEYAACVACFNCITACPTVGLKYAGFGGKLRPARSQVGTEPVSPSRRDFMSGAATAMVGAITVPADSVLTRAAQRGIGTRPVTPPGSRGIAHFGGRCTACHLCVSICPTQVLRPSLFEYGIAGILQPRMDFSTAYCTYDCVLCTSVCPSGAILPLSPEEKKDVQIGTSRFVKDDCIVETKKKDCGACAEHCPTKAVTMVPYGALMLPELRNELCVGCGACEHACPTIPYKAIFIVASDEHGRAKRPVIEKAVPSEEVPTEFPF